MGSILINTYLVKMLQQHRDRQTKQMTSTTFQYKLNQCGDEVQLERGVEEDQVAQQGNKRGAGGLEAEQGRRGWQGTDFLLFLSFNISSVWLCLIKTTTFYREQKSVSNSLTGYFIVREMPINTVVERGNLLFWQSWTRGEKRLAVAVWLSWKTASECVAHHLTPPNFCRCQRSAYFPFHLQVM